MGTSPLEDVLSRASMCLIARLLNNRTYHHEAFKETMQKIWRLTKPSKPIRFHELGPGMLLVEFEEKKDKERVMRYSSWNFDICFILGF